MSLFIKYPTWMSPFVFPNTTIFRWYSLMYLVAFVTAWLLLLQIFKKDESRLTVGIKDKKDRVNLATDLVVYVAIGLVLGARLGSVLIYSGSFYYKHPWLIFWPFQNGKFVGLPGMSYHGGVVGAIIAGLIYSKVKKVSFWDIADTLVCVIPFGYTWGRLGNFFNAELYGRVTASPLGMLFPDSSTEWVDSSLPWIKDVMDKVGIESASRYVNLPRFPSQLYEAFFEGIVVGAIMWFVVRPRLKKIRPGSALGLYLCLYGFARFFIEYLREPDRNLGYIIALGPGGDRIEVFTSILNISMGQILCFIMIVAGLGLILWAKWHSKNLLKAGVTSKDNTQISANATNKVVPPKKKKNKNKKR